MTAPASPGSTMSSDQAQTVILTSALVVGGAYAYRKLIETGGVPTSHPLPSFARWATGYGVAFFGVSVIAAGNPALGAWFAVLVAAGTLLVQGGQLAVDVNHRLGSAPAKTANQGGAGHPNG